MKVFLRYFQVAALALAVSVLSTGCKEDSTDEGPKPVEPSLTAELVAATSTTAELRLTTTAITEAAYAVTKAGEDALDPTVIFASGTRGINCAEGETSVTVRNLEPLTDYVIYVAGITEKEEFFDQVASVSVTTADFAEDLSIYDVDYASFKAHVKVPDNLAETGNVIRWGLCDLATYYMNSSYCDAERLNLSDEYYHNYFNEDWTYEFNNENSIVYDENGDPQLDETGSTLVYYDPIVPGGKYFAMFGEFAWGEHSWGFGEGYYSPLCDVEGFYTAQWMGENPQEKDYWTGFYQNVSVETKAPEVLNASLNITTNLRPIGGVVSVSPDEAVKLYCITILDDMTYQQVLSMVLNNDPDNMQWYITTYNAMVTIYAMSGSGPMDITLEDMLYIDKEATAHIFATGMGNEEGTSQCFEHITFQLPDPSMPAPELTVTPIKNPSGEESPYEVWFNVKCTSKDALSGMYACNYQREWESALKSGYTEETLIENGYELTSTEIGQINTDEGLNIPFSSREDATSYLGVIVYNEEGTASEPSVAQNTTIVEPAADPVNSELFTDLQGDWTATTTIQYKEYDSSTLDYVTKTSEISSKVTIGDVGYEATLPDDVYNLYYEHTQYTTKEQVDALYDEFKAAVDLFNEKAKNQNRLICQGLSLEIVTYQNYLEYASPYDLFISEDYNGFDSESPVFDFGPKWYLQIADGDKVSVPFNANLFTPLSAWSTNEYHLIGASETASLPYVTDGTSAQTGYFPVEVSADKNTITINPLSYNGDTYYMNPGRFYYGSYQLSSRIIAPITLTRGWNESGTTAKAAAAGTDSQLSDPANMKPLYKVTPVKKANSRTAMPTKPAVERKQVKLHVVTVDEFDANARKFLEKRFGKRN